MAILPHERENYERAVNLILQLNNLPTGALSPLIGPTGPRGYSGETGETGPTGPHSVNEIFYITVDFPPTTTTTTNTTTTLSPGATTTSTTTTSGPEKIYYINDAPAPTLTLHKGYTYVFDLSGGNYWWGGVSIFS